MHYGPWVDSVSKRNEYQEFSWEVEDGKSDGLIAIYEPIVDKMWEARRPTNLWASMACYNGSFTFYQEQFYTFNFPSIECLKLKHL
jgi:hypothetical protein